MNTRTLFVVLASALPATATPLTWDSDGLTGAPTGGSGTWDTSSLLWDNAGVMQAWTSGTTDTAVFGGTAGTVSLGEPITANGLQFDTTGYVIQSNILTLGGTTPTITAATGVTATITSTLAGSAGVVKAGEGTVVLSGTGTFTGGLTVNGGVFAVDGNQPGNRLVANSLVTVNNTGVFEIRGVNALPTAANSIDVAVNAGGILRVVTGGSAVIGAGGQSHDHLRNLTLSGGTIELNFSGGGSAYNGESFQLNGNVTVTGSAASSIITSGVGVSTTTQGVALSGTRTFTVNDVTGSTAADFTVSAELENTDGAAGSLIKEGVGTMALSSSNSYGGTTTVNAGTLQANAGGSLNGTSSITVNSGATLETNGTNVLVGGHGTALANTKVITLNNATWVMTAAHDARIGNVTLNNGSTWTSNRGLNGYDALLANTTTGAATVAVTGNAASTMNGSGGLHMQGVQNFDVADVTGNANADLTVSMQLDNAGSQGGVGGINKMGAGTMAISRQATYTGGTTINGGVLDLTGGGGSGGTIRGTVDINNTGVLRLSSGDVTGYGTGADRLSTININAGGNLHVNTVANQTLGSATINMTGSTITGIASSNLDFFNGASALNTLASANSSTISGVKVNMRQNGGLTFTVADGAAAQDLVVNSVISNSGSFTDNNLTKAGSGTMVINSVTTYTTQTRVNGGTLAIGASGSIGSSSSIALGLNTTLDVSAVSGWTLGAGQSLVGNGMVNGNAAIAGTLAIGNSVGQMNFNQNLTLLGISNFELDASTAAADLANVGGVLTFGGTLNVTNLAGSFSGGQTYNLFDFASSSGTFSALNLPDLDTANTGLSWNTSNLYTAGTLTVIPEPSAVALAGLSSLVLFRRRRQRGC